MAKNKDKDVLLGRRVEINDGFPYAGAKGTISKPLKGGQYEVELPTAGEGGTPVTYTYALSDFSVMHDDVAAGVPSTLVEADPYLVAFSPTNPRKRKGLDVESIAALASSIKGQGLAQPVLVRPLPGDRTEETFRDREEGRPLPIYELVCGERRVRASRIAGVATIPMMVRDLSDDQAVELQLVENIEREDLDPIEEAEGFDLLHRKFGYTGAQIAERIGRGKSKDYVYKTMKLVDLTPASREALYEGHLGRSTALIVARYPAEQQAQVVAFIKSQAVKGEPAPFRAIATSVFSRFNLDLKKAVWLIADETLVPSAGACTACPKRTGATDDLFGDDEEAPDSCTDADCFASKRAAHIERAKAEAKKQGLEVIDEEVARKAVSVYSKYIYGYTRLDATAGTETGNDGKEREITFEDALRAKGKKAPKPKLLINPHTGEAIKVIPEDLADQLLDEVEKKNGAGGGNSASKHGREEPPDERPEEVKALDSYSVRRALTMRIFEAVRNRIRTDAEVLLMAKVLFASTDDNTPPLVTTFLNWDGDLDGVDYGDVQGVVNAKLDALPAAEVAAIAAMAAIELATYSLGDGHDTHLQLAAAYGVDVVAVRDKVLEDEARQGGEDTDQDEATDDAEDDAQQPPAAAAAAAQISHKAAWPFPTEPAGGPAA